MKNLLNPSILSANFANLEKDFLEIEKNNIKKVHIDVMDGNFVPNITFGASQIKSLRNISNLYFDCHLMVDEPIRFIDDFIDAGVNSLGVHVEACTHIHRTLDYIKSSGLDCCVVLNPGTSLKDIENLIYLVDKILIMTVNPGFGGQKFIPNMLNKVRELRELLNNNNYGDKIIQVDGGINLETINQVYLAGARDIVVGSFIFNGSISENITKLINKLG